MLWRKGNSGRRKEAEAFGRRSNLITEALGMLDSTLTLAAGRGFPRLVYILP